MKEQENKLTIQETEQLCRLFMDCRLSVFEETQLQYVLSKTDYHSPLIDEVRTLMGVEAAIGQTGSSSVVSGSKKAWTRRMLYSSVAASVALIAAIGISLYNSPSSLPASSESTYIAYVDGKRLSKEDARLRIEEEMQSAEAFMKEMTLLEARNKEMIDNFISTSQK